jgi:hypothetical protein
VSKTTRLGLGAVGAALVLGMLADGLLRTLPWGLNVALWVGTLMIVVATLAGWQEVALTGGGRWLAAPALLLAAGLAWRDSAALGALNLLALGGLLALIAMRARAGRLAVGGVAAWAAAPFLAGAYAAFGPFGLTVTAIRWPELPRGRWLRSGLSVGLGLAIAAPLLLIFGGLFAAADAAFERVFAEVARWIFSELVVHVIMTLVFAWGVAGLLYQLFFGRETGDLVGRRPAFLGLGPIEIGIILGLLDALFLVFVALQLPYLFGGAALVTASATLTYAEYARRGFFELAVVAALALPLLLLFDWLARREHAATGRANCEAGHGTAVEAAASVPPPAPPAIIDSPRQPQPTQAGLVAAVPQAAASAAGHAPTLTPTLFRWLAAGLIALLLVVLASAWQRMWLYTTTYGLTEQRFYTTVFMGWLALVCLWFAATVLRGRRAWFASGAMAAAFVLLLGLNVASPDAVIVRFNAGRTGAAQPFDARYVASLSADAAPALLAALPALPERERRVVATQLLRRWHGTAEPDWRSWNWSRWHARWMVFVDEGALRQMAAGERTASTAEGAGGETR